MEKAFDIAQKDGYDVRTAEQIAMKLREQQDAALPVVPATQEIYLEEYLRLKKEVENAT